MEHPRDEARASMLLIQVTPHCGKPDGNCAEAMDARALRAMMLDRILTVVVGSSKDCFGRWIDG